MELALILSPKFYKTPEWHKLRRKALARDRYKCRHCGVSVAGKRQSRVDHIKPKNQYPELALELTNLRCLCPDCDNKRHREKGYRNEDVIPVNLDGTPQGWWDS